MKFCQSCGMPLQAEDQWGKSSGTACSFWTNSTGRPMFPGPGNKPWQK